MARKVYINGEEANIKKRVKLREKNPAKLVNSLMAEAVERVRNGEEAKIPEKDKKKLKKLPG